MHSVPEKAFVLTYAINSQSVANRKVFKTGFGICLVSETLDLALMDMPIYTAADMKAQFSVSLPLYA